MKLITFRNNSTGCITVQGEFGSVVISEDGHIAAAFVNGKVVQFSPDFTAEHLDRPSPREKRADRKRGAR
jgi:hypothetical protein